MAIICRKHKVLFIMTPRTACTAIGELLCTYYGGEFLPAHDILDSRGMIFVQKKHSTLSELIEHKLISSEELKSLLKIAAVRNPFDSLVSLYLKQRLKYRPLLADPTSWVHRSVRYARYMRYAERHSFNQWLLRVSYRKFVKRLLGIRASLFSEYTRGMDIILRYERIEEDLKETFRRAEIPWMADLPRVNRTDERKEQNYRSSYSALTQAAVRFIYAYDLKTYDYQF